ncbi:hypothetical protein ACFL3C_01980 [Patescibacteria group bacterium]
MYVFDGLCNNKEDAMSGTAENLKDWNHPEHLKELYAQLDWEVLTEASRYLCGLMNISLPEGKKVVVIPMAWAVKYTLWYREKHREICAERPEVVDEANRVSNMAVNRARRFIREVKSPDKMGECLGCFGSQENDHWLRTQNHITLRGVAVRANIIVRHALNGISWKYIQGILAEMDQAELAA